jgi:flavin-dependent dehydrogenase
MSTDYDLITVGGGLAGAALAAAMAERGARVLVVEREMKFKDRVRGEVIWPWGVAEQCKLGLDHLMRDRCAREIRWFDVLPGRSPGLVSRPARYHGPQPAGDELGSLRDGRSTVREGR